MSASRTKPGRHDGSKASVGVTLTDRPLVVEVGTSAPRADDAAVGAGSATWMLGLMVVMTTNIRQTAAPKQYRFAHDWRDGLLFHYSLVYFHDREKT